MEELIIQPGAQKPQTVWQSYVPIITQGRHTDVYLTDAIEAPAEYNELCHRLATAYKGDTFTLYINNGGGYVDSAWLIIDAIRNTKAKVHAHLSGTVASVATIITMACHSVYVAPYINFMIHNYSGGASGKGHEMRAQVNFTDAQLNIAFAEIYNGFLTPHEMELVIAGKDLWMGKVEVEKRLAARKSNDIEALEAIEAANK